MKNVALVLSGLLAGAVGGTILVPRVLAEGSRPAPAVRWQQFCEPASSIAEGSSIASARGTEGYELVGFAGGVLCFKRPAPLPADAAARAATQGRGDTSWPGY